MTYFAARLSFLKQPQTTFTNEPSCDPPIILAEKLLISGPEHYTASRMRRQVKGRVDFYIGNFLTDGSRLIAFKMGKRKIRPRGTFSKKLFKEIEEEHFPANTILWSSEHQIIFIEKPKKDQMSVRSIMNSLQDYLNGLLLAYGFSVAIELITYKSAFWEVIDDYEKIYSVEFTLIAPNFLNFSDGARELVNSTKENYNANETSIKIADKNGNLMIPKDDPLISNLLAWITAGAGKWATIVGSGKKKISVDSGSGSKKLNEDLVDYDVETAKGFTKKAADLIDKP